MCPFLAQLTTYAIVWQTRRSVRRCSTAIRTGDQAVVERVSFSKETTPKKVYVATVFWDTLVVIHTDYLPKENIVLEWFNKDLNKKSWLPDSRYFMIYPLVTNSHFQTWANGSAEMGLQRWYNCSNRILFRRPRQILSFGRFQEFGETLDEVYGAQRRDEKYNVFINKLRTSFILPYQFDLKFERKLFLI